MTPSVRHVTYGAVALVLIRSLVWAGWEQAHFDSDQAIHGLMAMHIADGQAWPVFMYGQTYLLAVEAWLAAPLVAVFGPTVAMLKLPLVAMNLAIAVLLIQFLTREVRLTPAQAFAAALPFLAAPPVPASRLVEAAGANVEPLLYALVLWMVRSRPVLVGVVAGVGFLHREFTAYAVAALAWIAWREGAFRTRTGWRQAGMAAASGLVVTAAIKLAATGSDVLGPGTAGVSTEGLAAGGTSRVCLDTAEAGANLSWLVSRNLSVLFGWREEPLAAYNLTSNLSTGHGWLLLPLGLLGGLAIALRLGLAGARRGAGTEPGAAAWSRFPVFLLLVGAQAALVYALASCVVRDGMLVRYTLLALLSAVGLAAWVLQSAASRGVRAGAVAALLVWGAASLWDSGRVLAEYVRHEPPNKTRRLIAHLDAERIRFGWAPYWTAYVVDYLSGERITLAASDHGRIEAYRRAVEEAVDRVTITHAPCDGVRVVAVEHWCIERHERPGGAAPPGR